MLDCPLVPQAIENEANTLLPQIMEADNPGLVWEGWKRRMANQLQSLQKVMAYQKDQGLHAAEKRLDLCMEEFVNNPSEATKLAYEEAKTRCEECKEHVYRLQQDSSFDYQAGQMEKSTSSFFRTPATSLRNVHVNSVQLDSGEISTDPVDVKKHFRAHWGTIFGDSNCVTDTTIVNENKRQFLLDFIEKRLSTEDSEVLEEPITALELTESIKHMRGNSAPGLDGLTAAFYQTALETFGKILCRVLQYQLERGILLPSQRKSCFTLLYKKRDRSDPGNYRPITLMPVDVKILSKALAYRLQKVLPSVIHPDQKGFVKGRSLHHQVRLLDDLQHFATHTDSEALALFLDFQKAYDRVIWDYLFLVLLAMGFGEKFISWIKLLYNKPLALLLLNGFVLQPLHMTRGVKQGDPLSSLLSLLFLLSIDPLGNIIRRRSDLGVPIGQETNITGLYFADDSTLISRSIEGIRQQLELVQIYCKGSGARLNLTKSALMPLNKTRTCPTMPEVRCLRPDDIIKYLGIPFGQQVTKEYVVTELNRRFYKGFLIWDRRARTVQGRLLLVHTVILSTLWHFTPHANASQQCIRRWQRMINKFILAEKTDADSNFIQLVPTALLHQRRHDGGLQFPHVKTQIQVQRLLLQQFVNQFLKNKSEPWVALATSFFSTLTPLVPVNHALSFLDISPSRFKCLMDVAAISEWWNDIWKLWHSIHLHASTNTFRVNHTLLHAPLWMSKNDALQYETRSAHRRNLLGVAEPYRSFQLQVARRLMYTTVADILLDLGIRPSLDEFLRKTLDPTNPTITPSTQKCWLSGLYRELKQILARVESTSVILS